MAERREDDSVRTNRPNPGVGILTVRDVLAEDAVMAGQPEAIVGGDALLAPVRWVHASDSANVPRLLEGGELILTTAAGWPDAEEELERLIESLVEVGAAGVVIELGTHYRWVPKIVERTARRLGLALVALHQEVKFVAITMAVHHTVISRQTAALRARDEVRERFTGLALRGSAAEFIVHQLGATLGTAVVLENLAHEVVAAEVPPAQETAVFTGWEARSRSLPTASDTDDTGLLIVPVEARGRRWGRLIAMPGPEHPAGRLAVLEQGAIALAVGRLADGDADEWARLGRRRLLDALLSGRFAATHSAAVRLAAAGVPIDGRRMYGIVIVGSGVRADRVERAAKAIGAVALLGSGPKDLSTASSSILLSLRTGASFDDAAAVEFARSAAVEPAHAVITVGSPADDLDGALVSLQEARDLAHGERSELARGPLVRRSDARPLLRLVTAMRDDHRLQEHGERMLAPLIEYDLARQGDLRSVLEAMLQHPTNRTAAAHASHLSRSVFYQRITLIQELLGVDLEDGEIQTALHLALLVRGRSA